MGCYDYLGDTQVKCFLKPHVYKGQSGIFEDGAVGLQYAVLGGDFHNYKLYREVPFASSYYNYGKNFVIYDFRSIESLITKCIFIIKDGFFVAEYSLSTLPTELDLTLVIDKDGNALSVKSIEDFHTLYDDYTSAEAACSVSDVDSLALNNSYLAYKENKITSDEFLTALNNSKKRYQTSPMVNFGYCWHDKVRNLELFYNNTISGLVYTLENESLELDVKNELRQLYLAELQASNKTIDEDVLQYFNWLKTNLLYHKTVVELKEILTVK